MTHEKWGGGGDIPGADVLIYDLGEIHIQKLDIVGQDKYTTVGITRPSHRPSLFLVYICYLFGPCGHHLG